MLMSDWSSDVCSSDLNLVDVQYSFRYCLGLVALLGPDALLPLDESALDLSDVTAFARKVSLRLAPEIDRRFPAESLARVVVTAGNRRFESPLTHPRDRKSTRLNSSH